MPGRYWMMMLCLLTWSYAQSQEVKFEGGFVQDSLGVGEEIQYWIRAEYPTNLEVLFPDSTFNFAPFEYVNKEFSPTVVVSDRAIDTTVYTLQSFEIDLVQRLSLPAFVLDAGDSIELSSPLDSIYFKELVQVVADTIPLIENTSYIEVNRMFNYPLFWIIIGVLVVVGIAVFFIYGDKIRRYFKARRMTKEYQLFSEKITGYIQSLKQSPDNKQAEGALAMWKSYVEKLETQPFSKLTTKEILSLDFTSELAQSLNTIDRSVYGGIEEAELYRSFQSIEDFTQHRFNLKIDELKHGNK